MSRVMLRGTLFVSPTGKTSDYEVHTIIEARLSKRHIKRMLLNIAGTKYYIHWEVVR